MSQEPYYERYKVDVPEGSSGRWTVKRIEVCESASALTGFMAMQHGRGLVRPGTYTQLLVGGSVMMSDTGDEIRDHLGFIRTATGDVLIHGLGLGMCARACLLKPEVESLTIVDDSIDVLRLVGPWTAEQALKRWGDAYVTVTFTEGEGGPLVNEGDLSARTDKGKVPSIPESANITEITVAEGDKTHLRIKCDDAFTWKPAKGQKWDVIWHDIWISLCEDNLKEMATLHRRFGRRARIWQGSWGKELLQRRRRERQRRGW